MAITNGKLETRITIPTGGLTVNFTDSGGSAATTMPAGDFYLSSEDTTANDFCAELALRLGNDGAKDAWTVTLDGGEGGGGKVTIENATTTSWGISWPTTAFGEIIGWTTGQLSPAGGPITGANHAKYLWIPDGPILSQFGRQVPLRESDARTTITPAGHLKALYGQRRAVYNLRWAVTRAKTFVEGETTTWESYEQFWIDSVLAEHTYATVGGPVRVYWDAADDTTYAECRYQDFAVYEPEPVTEAWTGLYWVSTNRLIVVPGSG